MSTKICTHCHIEKSLDNFYNSKKGKYGKESLCKLCNSERRKEYYNLNEKNIETPKDIQEEKIKSTYFNKKEMTCTKCKMVKTSDKFYYHRTRKCYMSSCKECNSKICMKYQRSKKTDLGYITQARASGIRRNSKYDNKEVASNLKDLLRLQWETQKGLCYYTRVPMVLSNEYHTNPNVMTVDRIDPTKGYVKGNLALCRSIVNRMKQDMTIEQFKALCQLILDS